MIKVCIKEKKYDMTRLGIITNIYPKKQDIICLNIKLPV